MYAHKINSRYNQVYGLWKNSDINVRTLPIVIVSLINIIGHLEPPHTYADNFVIQPIVNIGSNYLKRTRSRSSLSFALPHARTYRRIIYITSSLSFMSYLCVVSLSYFNDII